MDDRALHEDIQTMTDWGQKFANVAMQSCSGARYDQTDDLQVMSLVFLTKQSDHIGSMIRLGEHLDVALVARSMIEGLVQLKWAAQKPQERALRWRAFAFVHDWRLGKELLARNEYVDPEQHARSKAGLAQ